MSEHQGKIETGTICLSKPSSPTTLITSAPRSDTTIQQPWDPATSVRLAIEQPVASRKSRRILMMLRCTGWACRMIRNWEWGGVFSFGHCLWAPVRVEQAEYRIYECHRVIPEIPAPQVCRFHHRRTIREGSHRQRQGRSQAWIFGGRLNYEF